MSAIAARVRNLLEMIGLAKPPVAAPADDKLDEYVTSLPSLQNAVDLLPGWNHAFPPQFGVAAGTGVFFEDPRILWAIEQLGSLKGKRILEIGPLEAAHTYILDQQEPARIDALEANKLCYLRCLVAKEVYGLKNAHFYLGDCQLWLEQKPDRYDFIVASGVLYHMRDPIRFLTDMAARTDALFIWTHYIDDAAMPPDDLRRSVFVGEPEVIQAQGLDIRLYPRSYHEAWKNKSFCGGIHDLHRWMHRDDMLALLTALGFDDIRIWGDQPTHPNGPALSLLAIRRPPAQPDGG